MKKTLACMFVMALGLLSRSASARTIDAVSGSSISVTGGTTTSTAATISIVEGHNNGVLRFYWDTTNTTRTKMRDSLTVPSANRGGSTWKVGATYKPGKVYNYAFQGFYPNANSASNAKSVYAITGKFTMDAATGILHFRDAQGRPVANPFDAMGRPSAAAKAGNMRLTSQGAAPSLLP
jgi:hypothetical protein